MSADSNAWKLGKDSKLGLALSGGGFRASLFHIGVLARLAELDLLRQVEVLSTVSGGSIVGALYYLKVKQLLEGRRPDGLKPSSQAYVVIVQEIEREFVKGVQNNLRMRALSDPLKNARMMLSDDYSRSDRMAELYEEYFYRKIWHEMESDDQGSIRLKDIKITPAGYKVPFNVREYNKEETIYKVPILAINATILNTGESWLFTASYIGSSGDKEDNSALPYSKLRFGDAALPPKVRAKLDTINLADAVAASACVPVLLSPFAIHDLYQEDGKEVVVELVDGGVYDNQGLETLFREECTHIICSDASGQLQSDRTPNSSASSVGARSNEILMKRVREETLDELGSRVEHGLLKSAAFFHLRNTFSGTDQFPNLSEPVDRSDNATNGEVFLLSALRTDLDSFSDIEASVLMYDGYCLCDSHLNDGAGLTEVSANQWGFLRIRELMRHDRRRLIKHLAVGRNMLFKVFFLLGHLGWVIAALLVAGLLALLWLLSGTGVYQSIGEFCDIFESPDALVAAMAFGLLSWILTKLSHTSGLRFVFDAIRGFRTGNVGGLVFPLAILGAVGSLISYIHVNIFDRVFLKLGKL
ncbi:patatin-like phospholipase family protein [Methylococcus geothermalis]|uniref:Patatin family protein n=1 Tax=Methylococcus geothermalis TaxID=2681310 RepID=A0A858QAF6_9GAMM|nr:patatin-like phospholipase family protein [Methylococcus geothermalis]QJD30868.1 patatin family protein [Methylococcus geothermalis]